MYPSLAKLQIFIPSAGEKRRVGATTPRLTFDTEQSDLTDINMHEGTVLCSAK